MVASRTAVQLDKRSVAGQIHKQIVELAIKLVNLGRVRCETPGAPASGA